VSTRDAADTLIIGGGLIGLACAAALARDGVSCIVIDDAQPGTASPAAAGMLAPSIDRETGPAHAFAVAARARFPDYLQWLRAGTGIAVPLNTNGIIQVAVSPAGVRGLRRAMPSTARWLDVDELRTLEPDLTHALGAAFHPDDGAVDNVILLETLRAWCAASALVRMTRTTVLAITVRREGIVARGVDGGTYSARYAVLAAGAWASNMTGLPRRVPVIPVRGQMLAYPPTRLRHVLFGPRGYIIPRQFGASITGGIAGETLVGATSENVGFDAGTTADAAAKLRSVAAEILPPLHDLVPHRHWAGLRPMTPDLLPIIGRDRTEPSLVYACGHSRNGVLMAPLTGDCVSALIRNAPPPADLSPFSIERFPSHDA
jgi:glycine oxidase